MARSRRKLGGDAATATIGHVARKARVTDTTVSLAFQSGSRISSATRERVLKVAHELGYVPNFAARQLRRGASRSRVLGLLVTEVGYPFYALMAEAAEAAAERHGYRVALSSSHWTAARELAAVDGMIQSRLDGVLACFIEEPSTADAIARLERSGIPYITLDTCPPGHRGAAVLNDLREAGRLAARHLVEVGCKRPAFISAEPEHAGFSSFVDLIAGFRRGLQDLGAALPSARIIPGGQTMAAGAEAFSRLRAADEAIDGVFTVNAACALGVMEGADRAGVAIGRELAVVAMDDLEVCGLSRISLTAVRQPYGSLAAVAVDRLIEAIARGETPTGKQMLPPELIVRASTRRV